MVFRLWLDYSILGMKIVTVDKYTFGIVTIIIFMAAIRLTKSGVYAQLSFRLRY